MKKLIPFVVAIALTITARAEIALPLTVAKATEAAPSAPMPASVSGITLIPFMGDLIGIMPRKNSENCPVFARFRLLTVDSGVQSSTITATTKWDQDRLSTGHPICKATIKADQFAGLPRPGLKVFASMQVNSDGERRSAAIELRTVCTGSTCLLAPNSAADKRTAQGGNERNSTQQVDGCDSATQTCQTSRGTVGETILLK